VRDTNGGPLDLDSAACMKAETNITPDIVALMAAEVLQAKRAVSAANARARDRLKTPARADTGADFGRRLANSIPKLDLPEGGRQS